MKVNNFCTLILSMLAITGCEGSNSGSSNNNDNLGADNSLGTVLEQPSQVFSFSGDSDWTSDSNIFYAGNSSAKNGHILDAEKSCLLTNYGIGRLSFYWKVSSQSNGDKLKLYVNDAQQDAISGEIDWTYQVHDFVHSRNTVKWCYEKDNTLLEGHDAGWVDNVSFTPSSDSDSPLIAVPAIPSAPSLNANNGLNKIIVSWLGASEATSYKLYQSTSSIGQKIEIYNGSLLHYIANDLNSYTIYNILFLAKSV